MKSQLKIVWRVPITYAQIRNIELSPMPAPIHNSATGDISRSSTTGFTLVELIVTLAIAAILMTVAIPGFSNFVKDNRLVAGTNRLVTSLAYARSEAVKRGTAVSMCSSANGSACGGTWKDGWIVFTDAGTAGTVDGSDTVLRVEDGPKADLAISVSGKAYVPFMSTGFSVAACGEPCGTTDSSYARPLFAEWLASVIPARDAYAGKPTTTGKPSSETNDTSSSTSSSAVTELTLCDSRSQATGRKISIWVTGRFATSTVTCGS